MSSPMKFAEDDGSFKRRQSQFRGVVSAEPGNPFQPERNRYHLYVAKSCPWAHRTLMVRALKKLEDMISISVVHYAMDSIGWKFVTEEETPGAIPDFVNQAGHMRDIYLLANPQYEGRYTVPVLWDKKLNKIVNNESSEIIRMFNTSFNALLDEEAAALDLYPDTLVSEIEEINGWVYDLINNGVYKTGFATTQEHYDANVKGVFEGLDRVEARLAENAGRKYLVGDKLTEADIRLFPTVVRFDPAYHGHFKCNLKTIAHDYPHILQWARRIYQLPGIAPTVSIDHIKCGYYSIERYNPTQIVPINNGPDLSHPVVAP